MKTKLLGKSGIRVSELCMGAMTFGNEWGWGATIEECRKMIDIYFERGGNFIDTSVQYQQGESEKILGQIIHPNRDKLVIGTKFSLSREIGNPNAWGNHRKNMKISLETSLKRLDTDYIDLFWVHIWDFTVAVDEVMRALDDLISEGKILSIGLSDTPAWIVSESDAVSHIRGWAPVSAIQVEYSLLQRTPEFDLIPMARNHNISVLAWGPLASGVLSGKYRQAGASGRAATRGGHFTPKNDEIVDCVIKIAKEIGSTPSKVALSWLLQKDSLVMPILGARTPEQLIENLDATNVKLDIEHINQLDDLSYPGNVTPNSMWANKMLVDSIMTGNAGNIEGWKLPY